MRLLAPLPLLLIIGVSVALASECCTVAASAAFDVPSTARNPQALTFSPDGSLLVTANVDTNNVTVFRVSSSNTLSAGVSYSLPSASSTPLSVAFSPNGKFLATANYGSRDVTVFAVSGDVLSGTASYPLPAGSLAAKGAVFSPNGKFLATANSGSDDVSVFAVSASGVLSGGASYPLPSGSSDPQQFIAFSPDGTLLATPNRASADVTVFSVNATGGLSHAVSFPLPATYAVTTSLAFAPSGKQLAATCDAGVALYAVTGGSLTLVGNYDTAQDLQAVVFSLKSSCLYACSIGANNVTAWSVAASGSLMMTESVALPSTAMRPYWLTLSPSGNQLATANAGLGVGTVALFDAGCGAGTSSGAATGGSTGLVLYGLLLIHAFFFL